MRCRSCGATLPQGARVCPECGSSRRLRGRRYVICGSCGSRSPRGIHLCPVCGEVLRVRHYWLRTFVLLLALVGAYLVARGAMGGGADRREAMIRTTTNTPTATVWLLTATPEGYGSARSFPTSTETPAPTETVAPTSTPTLSPTATGTAVPTATATPRPSDTPVILPPVRLLSPEDGTRFQGRRTRVILQWESVGPLGEDEWYGVSLRYWADGGLRYSGAWVKQDNWLVPKELHRKPDPKEPGFQWDVTLMLQTGTKADGGRDGVPVNAVSETREFYWD